LSKGKWTSLVRHKGICENFKGGTDSERKVESEDMFEFSGYRRDERRA